MNKQSPWREKWDCYYEITVLLPFTDLSPLRLTVSKILLRHFFKSRSLACRARVGYIIPEPDRSKYYTLPRWHLQAKYCSNWTWKNKLLNSFVTKFLQFTLTVEPVWYFVHYLTLRRSELRPKPKLNGNRRDFKAFHFKPKRIPAGENSPVNNAGGNYLLSPTNRLLQACWQAATGLSSTLERGKVHLNHPVDETGRHNPSRLHR
jgi:hypothetical protein